MPKTSIVVKCAALAAVVGITNIIPAGASAPARPVTKPAQHQVAVAVRRPDFTPPTPKPQPTCPGPVVQLLERVTPFIHYCPE